MEGWRDGRSCGAEAQVSNSGPGEAKNGIAARAASLPLSHTANPRMPCWHFAASITAVLSLMDITLYDFYLKFH